MSYDPLVTGAIRNLFRAQVATRPTRHFAAKQHQQGGGGRNSHHRRHDLKHDQPINAKNGWGVKVQHLRIPLAETVHCAETNTTRQPNVLKSKRRQRCESKIPHSSRSTGFLEAPALLLQLIKRDDMQKIQASGNQANYHQTWVQRIDCCMVFFGKIS